jgi:uncharacterized RDD family membrane protein YckC
MRYVSVGRRFGATVVDVIVISVVTLPFARISHSGTYVSVNWSGAGAAAAMAVWFGYYIVLEAVAGATVGKWALQIRVVRTDGSKLGWAGSLVRNTLRLIDFLPFAYLLGAILIWTSGTRQRLGDRSGKSVVIEKGSNRIAPAAAPWVPPRGTIPTPAPPLPAPPPMPSAPAPAPAATPGEATAEPFTTRTDPLP